MKRRVFWVSAFAVLNLLSKHAYSQSGVPSTVQSESIRKNGHELRDDIIAAYKKLNVLGKLRLTGGPNDVGSTVIKYLYPGMPFADAELMLESAGLSVSARPGLSAAGDRTDRYDVYATSSSIFGEKSFGMKQELIIVISPNSKKTYETVKSVIAEIYVRLL